MPVTYQTSIPGIFAGGDMFTGPSIAVEAVAAGQQAAISIEKFLLGEDAHRKPTGQAERQRLEAHSRKTVRCRKSQDADPAGCRTVSIITTKSKPASA